MNENPNQNFPVNSGNNNLEVNVPSGISPEPKGSPKKMIIIAAVVAAAVIVIAAVLALVLGGSSSPKDVVTGAAGNTANKLLGGIVGNDDSVTNIITSQSTETKYSITYKSSDYYEDLANYEGLGIEGTLLYDPNGKEMSGDIDVSVAGVPISLAEFYADTEAVYGRSPQLENSWIKADLQNIFSKYNDSYLAESGGEIEYNEDLSIDLFELVSKFANSNTLYNYLNADRDAFDKFKSSMTVEASENTYTMDNGKNAAGYTVTVNSSEFADIILDLNDYIKEENTYGKIIEDFLPLINTNGTSYTAEELENQLYASYDETCKEIAETLEATDTDIQFVVYIYKTQIVKAEYDYTVEDSGLTIDMDAVFPSGDEDNSATNITVKLTDDDYPDEPVDIIFDLEYSEATTEYSLSLSLDYGDNSNSNVYMTSEGTYEKTKDSVKLAADDISISDSSGNKVLSIGMTLDVNPLSDSIEKPDDSGIFDLFKAEKSDFETLQKEVQGNVLSFYTQFSSLFN